MTCLASATPRSDSSFRVTQPMHVSAGDRPNTDYTHSSTMAYLRSQHSSPGCRCVRALVGACSPLIGADLAAAGSVPSSASTVICGGVAGPIGCAGRCGGRTTERLHEGGLPPKRLNLSKSNLPKEGRGLCRGALVSQPLELFRSVQTDSTFVLTGPGGSETRSSSLVQPFVEGVRAHVAQEQPNDGWCVGWSVDTFHLTHPR
jgi:hypothetical protein